MESPGCPSWPSFLPSFTSVVQLASNFGPFLFAILFIVVVTRVASAHYRDCVTRKEPAPSPQEMATYRFYFVCSITSGLALTALAVGWWMFASWRGDNRYQVTFYDLNNDQHITSSYYSLVSKRGETSPIHDDLFLIVRDTPFNIGEKFRFAFSTGTPPTSGLAGSTVFPLEITYSGNNSESYSVDFSNGKAKLVAADESNPHKLLLAAAGR